MATSLRARLLLGIGFAVLVPFTVFAVLGNAELRRSTQRNLGRHLLNSEARRTAQRIEDQLTQIREVAEALCATAEMRAMFRGAGGGREGFELFHARVSELLGEIVLLDPEGNALYERRLSPGLFQALEAHVADGQLRFFEPIPNPMLRGVPSSTKDPELYVLPLVVPMLADTQEPLGIVVFLLPFGVVLDEIERTHRYLVDEAQIAASEVYLVDRRSERYLLHTDRGLIATAATMQNVEGFATGDDGKVLAASEVRSHGSLAWSAGVRADAAELFRSVDTLSGFFAVLVGLVLVFTIGIAVWISLVATRSLARLAKVTETFGEGHLDARAEESGPRETQALARSFNEMADRIERDREQLKIAERDRAWTAMARQIAHEIKNPLQPVRLHAELLLRSCAEAEAELDAEGVARARRSAEVILRQVDALKRIVSDFSVFAQASAGVLEARIFAASDVLHEIVELYSAGVDGVAVRVEDESGGTRLRGDPLRLQQVLVNLIKNAIEAMVGEADVTRGASGDAEAARQPSRAEASGEQKSGFAGDAGDPPRVDVVAGVEGAFWFVEVRDRGPGLPDGELRVFEPSFSTKPGGTGLGLAISQRNVDAMGGEISICQREGGGVVVRVDLPRASA